MKTAEQTARVTVTLIDGSIVEYLCAGSEDAPAEPHFSQVAALELAHPGSKLIYVGSDIPESSWRLAYTRGWIERYKAELSAE